MLLYPGQFAVIIDSSNFNLLTYTYYSLIPDTARILFINNSTFGSGGLNASTAETVMLIKPAVGRRDTLSKYKYSLGNTAGYSDEKIELDGDNSSANFTNSIYQNGTPGNYPELDLSIKKHRLTFDPASPPTNTAVSMTAIISNMAIRTAESFEVKFYEDTNKNYNADDGEEVDSVSYFIGINYSDSVMAQVNSNALSSGTHIFIAKLLNISPPDTSLSNNMIVDSVTTVPAMDLAVSTSSLTFTPSNPKAGDNLQIRAQIKNTGLSAATAYTVKFYEDINRNVSPDFNEFLDSVNFSGTLNIGDSNDVSITVNGLGSGSHPFLAIIIPSSVVPLGDEVSYNDQRMDSVMVTVPDSITLTEVMFDPSGDEGFDEFIEIYNYSVSQTYDLTGWKISDSTGVIILFLPERDYCCFPNNSESF